MRVLQINVVCGQGSTGRIVVDIANMLKSKGDEAYIAYGYGSTDYLESYRITTKIETRINAHLFARIGRQGRGTKYGTKKLLNWIDRVNPDIIHLHNIHGFFVNYPMLFEYIIKKSIPVVWTIHDCWPITGACAHFVMANCNKWKSVCNRCSYNGVYKEKSLIDNSRTNFNIKKNLFTSVHTIRLIPVSKWMANVVKESFLNNLDSQVIYNGIDLSVYRYIKSNIKNKLGIEDAFLVLGVASQWDDMKGLSDFGRLAELISDDFKIVLVGLQKHQILSLPKNIIGVLRTDNINDLVELYSAADVTLSLSYAESMGLTIIESMACGTPVIAYNNTAQPELITQETGFIVENGDIKKVAKCILKIKNMNRGHLSQSCRNRVLQLYDKQERYNDYYNVYKDILASPNLK